MIVEAGRYYRTRSGLKAYVAALLPARSRGDDKFFVFVGVVFPKSGDMTRPFQWGPKGQASTEAYPDDFDLMEEWSDPHIAPSLAEVVVWIKSKDVHQQLTDTHELLSEIHEFITGKPLGG